MNKKKILKKIIPFWEDTEAISPVVATILVLAVAVAAGLGLYLWFNPFQASVQTQVQNSSASSVNLMAESTLGNNVLKVALPVGEFTRKSTIIDVDNDGLLYKPISSGDYSKAPSGTATYINTWMEERFIQEIPVYIENRGPNPLTNVKVKYIELPSTLTYMLRLDRNKGYQLLKLDGKPAKVDFSTSGILNEDSTSAHEYYFNGTIPAINYAVHTVNYTATQNSSTFANHTLTVLKIYDADGKTGYAYAKSNGTVEGWNTAGTLFAGSTGGGLNATLYEWSKSKLQDPTYEVGTLNPGEKKTVYTYFFAAYIKKEYCDSGSFKDCRINLPIQVNTDQGATQTVTPTLHIIDTDYENGPRIY